MGDLTLDHSPCSPKPAHSLTPWAPLYEARALVGPGTLRTPRTRYPHCHNSVLTIYQRLGSPEIATITGYLADLRHDTDQHPQTA